MGMLHAFQFLLGELSLQSTILDHLIEATVVTSVGLFTFLVKSFFSRIHDDLKGLKSSIDKLEGHFSATSRETRDATIALAALEKASTREFRALWRSVENAHRRTSDELNSNGGDEE